MQIPGYIAFYTALCLGEKHQPKKLVHTTPTLAAHSDPQHAEQLTSHHLSYQNEYRQCHLLILYYARFLEIRIWLNAMPNCETSTAVVKYSRTQGYLHDTCMKQGSLKIEWLRISLPLQDTAKAKPDREPTPKSLIYQLHYLVMQSVWGTWECSYSINR